MFIKHFIYSRNWSLLLFSPEPIKIDKDEDICVSHTAGCGVSDTTPAPENNEAICPGGKKKKILFSKASKFIFTSSEVGMSTLRFFANEHFGFFCPLEKNLFRFVFIFEFKEKQRFIYCLLIRSWFLFLNFYYLL